MVFWSKRILQHLISWNEFLREIAPFDFLMRLNINWCGVLLRFLSKLTLTLLNWKIASCRPHWDFWSWEWSKYRLREVTLGIGLVWRITLLPFMLSWYRTLTNRTHWTPFIEKQRRRVKLRHCVNTFFIKRIEVVSI